VLRVAAALFFILSVAGADNVLHPGTPQFDRPTLMALGIKLPVSGDDNYNAKVTVRYRKAGTKAWREALPLHRVHPEVVQGWTVEPQFSGSVFDLRPANTYDITLHVTDPDGPVDQVFTLTGTTRGIPKDPPNPNVLRASDTAGFKAALSNAQPGDVIVLANGVYSGQFSLGHGISGTPENPIVIRGESQEGVILDGAGCSCNVLEVYESFVHVERLTIQNATRALRFQGKGAEGNVVRRVHTRDTTLGLGSNPDQKDFYIADNVMEGRLRWPQIYTDDNGAHSNDDGIKVEGFGHVVSHNRISGFGDAMKVEQDGARAVDFYGNDVLTCYDNGIELDGSEANSRAIRNRFTNCYATLSVQPIFGGPAYLLRNVVVNTVHEQMKFHALGGTPPREPSGIYAYHNTFVSPVRPLNLESSNASHYFEIRNNLFVGPAQIYDRRTVNWSAPFDHGIFDYNGYYPDGDFKFTNLRIPSFAALAQAGLELHGVVLSTPVFANGLTPPADFKTQMEPADAPLDSHSNAIDRGVVLPNVNDSFTGSGPDLGAVESDCPAVVYGPRPEGMDESNEPLGCEAAEMSAGPRIPVRLPGRTRPR
jgi:hypothetical protein